jgi:hypothetical protein
LDRDLIKLALLVDEQLELAVLIGDINELDGEVRQVRQRWAQEWDTRNHTRARPINARVKDDLRAVKEANVAQEVVVKAERPRPVSLLLLHFFHERVVVDPCRLDVAVRIVRPVATVDLPIRALLSGQHRPARRVAPGLGEPPNILAVVRLAQDALLVVRIGLTPELTAVWRRAVVQAFRFRAEVIFAAVPNFRLRVDQLDGCAPRRDDVERNIASVRVSEVVQHYLDLRDGKVGVHDKVDNATRVVRPLE